MKYIVKTLNHKIVESNVSAKRLKEEYGIDNPSRAARKGMIVQGKYQLEQIEN